MIYTITARIYRKRVNTALANFVNILDILEKGDEWTSILKLFKIWTWFIHRKLKTADENQHKKENKFQIFSTGYPTEINQSSPNSCTKWSWDLLVQMCVQKCIWFIPSEFRTWPSDQNWKAASSLLFDLVGPLLNNILLSPCFCPH